LRNANSLKLEKVIIKKSDLYRESLKFWKTSKLEIQIL
jgi:hypothetical protein